jgi:hypothetical protein
VDEISRSLGDGTCSTPYIPTTESLNPGIQGIAPDPRGNLWIVPDEPSLSDRNDNPPMGQIVELVPAA